MQNTTSTADELLRRETRHLDDRRVLLDRRRDFAPGSPITNELAQAAERARPIYEEYGSAPPGPLDGEDARTYRLRILDELKRLHPRHRDASLRALAELSDDAFNAIETEVIDTAFEAAKQWAPPGQLRARHIKRADGVTVVEWAGDPRVWLSQFEQRPRAVKKFFGPGGVSITANRAWAGPSLPGHRAQGFDR